MSGLEQMLQGIDPDLIGAAIALGSVILIDIVLASDNALVIGLAAAVIVADAAGLEILGDLD